MTETAMLGMPAPPPANGRGVVMASYVPTSPPNRRVLKRATTATIKSVMVATVSVSKRSAVMVGSMKAKPVMMETPTTPTTAPTTVAPQVAVTVLREQVLKAVMTATMRLVTAAMPNAASKAVATAGSTMVKPAMMGTERIKTGV